MSEDLIRVNAPSSPFHLATETFVAPEGETIEDILREIGIEKRIKASGLDVVLFVGDRLVPAHEWSVTKPKRGEVISIRFFPTGGDGGGKNILRAVAMIAVIVASYYAAPAVAGYFATVEAGTGALAVSSFAVSAAQFGLMVIGSMAVNALFPPQLPSLGGIGGGGMPSAPAIDRRNSLTGIRNSMAPNGRMPEIFGQHKIFPLYGAEPIVIEESGTSYFYGLFVIGRGDYDITDWKIGDTPIKDAVDDYEMVQYNTDNPLVLDSSGTSSGEETRLFKGDYKAESFSLNLEEDQPQYRVALQTGSNFYFNFTLNSGLYAINSNGDLLPSTVNVSVYYRDVTPDSSSSGTPWTLYEEFEISDKTTTPFNITKEVNLPHGEYEFKVVRTSPPLYEEIDELEMESLLDPGGAWTEMTEDLVGNQGYTTFYFPKGIFNGQLLENRFGGNIVVEFQISYDQGVTWQAMPNAVNLGVGGKTNWSKINFYVYIAGQSKPDWYQIQNPYFGRAPYYYTPFASLFPVPPPSATSWSTGTSSAWRLRARIVENNVLSQCSCYWWRTYGNSPTLRGGKSIISWTKLVSHSERNDVDLSDTTIVELKVVNTDKVNGFLDSLNCIVQRKLETYDSSGWSGTREATRSAAWAFAEVLRGPSNHRRLSDSLIDGEILKDWADALDTEGRNFDAVVDFESTVGDILNRIASAGRAKKVVVDGKWQVIREPESFSPVQHFGPRNSWNFKGSKVFPRLPHGFRVQFINEDGDYMQDEVIAYDDGYSETGDSSGTEEATLFETMDLWGITDPDIAWKDGRYYIAQARLRAEEYSFDVHAEHIICLVGSPVLVTHDALLVGQGQARITDLVYEDSSGGRIAGIVMDSPIAMEVDSSSGSPTYAVEIRKSNGDMLSRSIVADDGTQSEVTFTTPIEVVDAPSVGDLVAFGESDLISIECLVKDIKPKKDFCATITVVPAETEAINAADAGDIPAFTTKISHTPTFWEYPPRPFISGIAYDPTKTVRKDDGVLEVHYKASFSADQVEDEERLGTIEQFEVKYGLRRVDRVYYGFSSNTSMSEPGAGNFRLNNADLELATKAAIDGTDLDSSSQTDILDEWAKTSRGVSLGYLYIQREYEPSTYVKYKVSDITVHGDSSGGPEWFELTIEYMEENDEDSSGSEILGDGDSYFILFDAFSMEVEFESWLIPASSAGVDLPMSNGEDYLLKVRSWRKGKSSSWVRASISPRVVIDDPDAVTGLQTIGGSTSSWSGRDLAITWDKSNDLYFDYYEVIVRPIGDSSGEDDSSGDIIKTRDVKDNFFIYLYSENVEDFGFLAGFGYIAETDFQIDVRVVNRFGDKGEIASLWLTKDSDVLPNVSGLSATSCGGAVVFKWASQGATKPIFDTFLVRTKVSSGSWSGWIEVGKKYEYKRYLSGLELYSYGMVASIYIEVKSRDVFGRETVAQSLDEQAYNTSPVFPFDFYLIGYWPLNETGGLAAEDESRNNNIGTLEGDMTDDDWVDGVSGRCLDFDGVDDRLDVGNSSPLSLLGSAGYDFSISFWMQSGSHDSSSGDINENGSLFFKNTGNDNYFGLQSNGTENQLRLLWKDSHEDSSGISNRAYNYEDTPVFDQEWHHVVLVRDGDVLYLYVDAVRHSEERDISSAPDVSNDGNLSFGAPSFGTAEGGATPYLGKLDEIRIYSKALTEQEVQALFQNPGGTGSSGLNGIDGASSTRFKFSSSTSMADPGSGYIRLNNATLASATALAIDETTVWLTNVSDWISSWDDHTGTRKGILQLTKSGAPSTFHMYYVTAVSGDSSAAGWFEVTLEHISGSGEFSADDIIIVGFLPRGENAIASYYIVDVDGDGEYTTIEDAVDDLPAGGGTIFVKAGTYTGVEITLPNKNIEFIAENKGVTLQNNAGDDFFAIASDWEADVTFDGFTFDSQNTNPWSYAIYCYDGAWEINLGRLQVFNCRFNMNNAAAATGDTAIAYGYNTYGTGTGTADNFIISGCEINGGAYGVRVSVGGNDEDVEGIIENNIIKGTIKEAIYGHNALISGNIIKDAYERGILVSGEKTVCISNKVHLLGSKGTNNVEGISCGVDNVKVQSNDIYIVTAQTDISITGIRAGGAEGIIVASNQVTIDAEVESGGSDIVTGIEMDHGLTDSRVSGNIINVDNTKDDSSSGSTSAVIAYGIWAGDGGTPSYGALRNNLTGNKITLYDATQDIGIYLGTESEDNQGGDNIISGAATAIDDDGTDNSVTGKAT